MSDERDWAEFKKKLFDKSTIDLNQYKPAQMQRRITNLMARHGVKTYVEWFNKINSDPKLYKDFIDYLTINVTEFFRTPEKFDELEKYVFADLMAKSPRLAIWSAGCSIGAEPYSIAMALNEMTPGVQHKILATDLDLEMLAKAKQGVYSLNEIKNIPQARLKKYFTETNGQYQISEDIKRKVEFKRHNLLLDKFETGFDLILCRNVVIYFTEEAKDQLYRRFFAALKPGGVLFVGGTEAILNFRDMGFVQYRPFFYRKP